MNSATGVATFQEGGRAGVAHADVRQGGACTGRHDPFAVGRASLGRWSSAETPAA
jgi:hypothetical protein